MNNEPVAWTNKDELAKYRPIIAEKEYSIHFPIPLYTHPAKELHLSLQKDKETGELLAVTYTDDEHRIVEVLWQRPPVKELNDGGEPVKNATYWKRQYNLMASQNDNLKSGLYHANEQIKYLESHPAELTDEEIWKELTKVRHTFIAEPSVSILYKEEELFKSIRAILKKAQDK